MKTPLNTPMHSRFFSLRNLSLFLTLQCLLVLASAPRAFAQSAPSPAASATSAVPTARITQPIDETKLVTIRGNVHPLARAEFDQGPAPDSQPMNRMLLLLQRSADQQATLSKLMQEQVTPGSANLHNWLTPQQFGAQFGPSDADIQTVTTWLTQHGFQGIKVANGKVAIEFSGNVAQVRSAFHTGIHHFMVNGQLRSANISDPQFPAALTPAVQGIVSLHNFPRKSHLHNGGVHNARRGTAGNPQFTTTTDCGPGGTSPCYVVGPADFATIYNTPTTTVCPGTVVCNGAGVTIGIVGDSNINAQDAADFRALFGLPVNAVNIILDGPDPGTNGDEIEADLDTQVSGMVATNANIDFVTAEGTFTANGTDLAAFHIIDYNLTDILSESFGTCELALGSSGEAFYSSVWEQAASQGISVFVSAGDNGAAACDDFNTESAATQGLAVNGLASSDFNVAVGGTDFDDAGTQTSGGFWSSTNASGTRESALGYIHEIPWNDSCAAGATSSNLNTVCSTANDIVAGSGGQSVFTTRPPWQTGLSPSGSTRLLPDVSLFASDGPPTSTSSDSFYLVCEADAAGPQSCASSGSFTFFAVGGTSASTPAFAGVMALIDQYMGSSTKIARQGNPNPFLYKIATTAANVCNSTTEPVTPASAVCVFNDITKGNNSVPCAGDPTKTTGCSSATANVNGVLVEPTSSTTPAWTAVAGYDLASGLGSVNIANLAAQWKTAVTNLKGTTTTLTLPTPTTFTHGQSVTASATVAVVSPATGTPSGDVSLLGPQGTINSGINSGTLSGGSTDKATLNTTFLPGGSYSVTAHYAGDGTFAPSDSSPIAVTVNPEQSTLQMEVIGLDPSSGAALSLNATSYTYGSPVIMRFDILNSSGNACQIVIVSGQVTFGNTTTGCAFDAQGSVSVTDSGGPLSGSPFNINSEGHSEDQNFNLTAGSTAHAISATYSGDVNYKPPTSPVTTSITVSQAATFTGLASSALTVTETTPVTITATIGTTSGGLGPTGTVTFFNGTTQIGSPIAVTPSGATPTLFASGTAALTTSFATLGSQSITAKYNGDTNYTLSTATAISINVTSPGSFTMAASAATVATTAGSGASTGTSTVTLTPSGGFNGPVAITCASIPGVTCNALTISPPGSTTGSLTINVANPSSAMTAMAAPQTQYLWAANHPVSPRIKTGLWTFSGGTGLAAIFLLLLPGRKRLRAALGLGLMCVLSFALGCGGSSGGGGGGGGGPVATITKLTVSSTKVANSASASITVSAAVTGNVPTGSVLFLVDGTTLGSAAPLTSGSTGSITVTAAQAPAFLQLVGTHSVTAQYSGDAGNQASSSGVLNVTITGTTSLPITANPGSSNAASNPSVALTIN